MNVKTENLTNQTNLKSAQLKYGPYVVISVVVWEFFSYYGMMSLLILYLTQSLHFSDQYSYSIFGAYSALTLLTPIIGGFIADNYFGNRLNVILGATLIMLGHFSLALNEIWSLYLGLSLLICGVGFFKTSAICLIGEYYTDPEEKNHAFIIYYMGGNIGAALAPLLCGYFAAKLGWDYGFAIAGLGMLFGIIILFVFRKYLAGMGKPRITFCNKNTRKFRFGLIAGSMILLLAFLAFINLTIVKLWSGYLLVVITIAAVILTGRIYVKSEAETKNGLRLVFILTFFATLFWIFCQQGGSSISLFIERFVDRNIMLNFGVGAFAYKIPTAMFQTINPAGIVVFGIFITYLLKKLAKRKIILSSITRMTLGIGFLIAGFLLITIAADKASVVKTSMLWVVLGLAVMSFAEVFIDPVILGVISKVAPQRSLSTLTAVYYLFIGAIANYLAAQVAKFTAAPTQNAMAVLYKQTYEDIVYVGLIMLVALLLLHKWKRFSWK